MSMKYWQDLLPKLWHNCVHIVIWKPQLVIISGSTMSLTAEILLFLSTLFFIVLESQTPSFFSFAHNIMISSTNLNKCFKQLKKLCMGYKCLLFIHNTLVHWLAHISHRSQLPVTPVPVALTLPSYPIDTWKYAVHIKRTLTYTFS